MKDTQIKARGELDMLNTIFLLISGFHILNKIFMIILTAAMCLQK